MPKLSEILDVEKQRLSPESFREIRLWTDGSFYRAYEWSAWLCIRYVRQFKVTKRYIKNIDTDVLFVGFPQSSLDKFKVEGSMVEPWDNKGVLMTLPAGRGMLPGYSREVSCFESARTSWRCKVHPRFEKYHQLAPNKQYVNTTLSRLPASAGHFSLPTRDGV